MLWLALQAYRVPCTWGSGRICQFGLGASTDLRLGCGVGWALGIFWRNVEREEWCWSSYVDEFVWFVEGGGDGTEYGF